MNHCVRCGTEILEIQIERSGGLCINCLRYQKLEHRVTKLENLVRVQYCIGIVLFFSGAFFSSSLFSVYPNLGIIFIVVGGILFFSSLVFIIDKRKR